MTKQLVLGLLDTGRAGLDRTFAAVPDDKLNWRPLDLGRSALDLYGEAAQTCATVNGLIQSGGQMPGSPGEIFARMRAERADWDRQSALVAMEANYAALKASVEALSEEELARLVTLPMGGGTTLPLSGWVLMAYRTFISRFAGINYIQTLYGDTDLH